MTLPVSVGEWPNRSSNRASILVSNNLIKRSSSPRPLGRLPPAASSDLAWSLLLFAKYREVRSSSLCKSRIDSAGKVSVVFVASFFRKNWRLRHICSTAISETLTSLVGVPVLRLFRRLSAAVPRRAFIGIRGESAGDAERDTESLRIALVSDATSVTGGRGAADIRRGVAARPSIFLIGV